MTRPRTSLRDTHPKALALLAVLLVGALSATPLALGSPHGDEATQGWPSPAGWPEYGGTHHRAGYAPVIGPGTSSHAPGTNGADGTGLEARSYSSPVFDNEGNLYVGDISARVTKLSPTLEKIWVSKPLGDGQIRSSVLVGLDDKVYVAPAANTETDGNSPADGDLFALDKQTGDIVWRHGLENIAPERSNYVLTAAPAYHPDGYILQGSMDGHLYAVTLEGEPLWRFLTHDEGVTNRVVSTPAISENGSIYFGSQNGFFYALAPDGEELWHFEAREEATGDDVEEIVASPSIGPDGTVYFGTRHRDSAIGVVYALDPEGELQWATVLDEKVVAPVTIRDDGTMFAGALDGTIYRLDPTDGDILWQFNPHEDDNSISLTLDTGAFHDRVLTLAEQMVADDAGRVYASYWHVDLTGGFPPENSLRSPVYALDGETGDIQWRHIYDRTQRAPAMMPTVHEDDDGRPHGILYLSGDDGRVRAVGEVAPDPVVLPPPGIPEDPPEAPEEDVTIQPDDLEDDADNETGQEDENERDDDDPHDDTDDHEDNATQQGETQEPTRPRPLLEELPGPHALLALIAGLMLALLRRQRRRA